AHSRTEVVNVRDVVTHCAVGHPGLEGEQQQEQCRPTAARRVAGAQDRTTNVHGIPPQSWSDFPEGVRYAAGENGPGGRPVRCDLHMSFAAASREKQTAKTQARLLSFGTLFRISRG